MTYDADRKAGRGGLRLVRASLAFFVAMGAAWGAAVISFTNWVRLLSGQSHLIEEANSFSHASTKLATNITIAVSGLFVLVFSVVLLLPMLLIPRNHQIWKWYWSTPLWAALGFVVIQIVLIADKSFFRFGNLDSNEIYLSIPAIVAGATFGFCFSCLRAYLRTRIS